MQICSRLLLLRELSKVILGKSLTWVQVDRAGRGKVGRLKHEISSFPDELTNKISNSGRGWIFFPLQIVTKTQRDTRAKTVCTDVIRTTSVSPAGQQHYSWLQTTDGAKGRPMTDLRWCQCVLGVMCLQARSKSFRGAQTERMPQGWWDVFISKVLCRSSCQQRFSCVEYCGHCEKNFQLDNFQLWLSKSINFHFAGKWTQQRFGDQSQSWSSTFFPI